MAVLLLWPDDESGVTLAHIDYINLEIVLSSRRRYGDAGERQGCKGNQTRAHTGTPFIGSLEAYRLTIILIGQMPMVYQ